MEKDEDGDQEALLHRDGDEDLGMEKTEMEMEKNS